jgi:ribokinase
MDLVIRCHHLPVPGETCIGLDTVEICGGKGGNQAVAAARAGGDVCMIGRVGDDGFAQRLKNGLEAEQIDCQLLQASENCASGIAVVMVEASGQNSIMVVPGANGQLTVDDVNAAAELIQSCDVLVLQLEVPIKTVLAAIHVARKAETTQHQVRVLLDPAPAIRNYPAELLAVDVLCPNESEAEILLGRKIITDEELETAAWDLHCMGAKHVILTLGDRGALLCDGQSITKFAPYSVSAIDTTAAGDAFAGALAVYWMKTGSLHEAISYANAAGALAASKSGAQPSLPTMEQIEHMRQQQR